MGIPFRYDTQTALRTDPAVQDLNKLFGPDLELAELRHLQLIQDLRG